MHMLPNLPAALIPAACHGCECPSAYKAVSWRWQGCDESVVLLQELAMLETATLELVTLVTTTPVQTMLVGV